jgi:hypothetical protein
MNPVCRNCGKLELEHSFKHRHCPSDTPGLPWDHSLVFTPATIPEAPPGWRRASFNQGGVFYRHQQTGIRARFKRREFLKRQFPEVFLLEELPKYLPPNWRANV